MNKNKQQEVLPSAIAGAVFAFLALILFFLLIIWMAYRFCGCCGCSRCVKCCAVKPLTAKKPRQPSNPKYTKYLRYSILFFGFCTIVLSIWGIPESLIETSDQINGFWDIVDGVGTAANATSADLIILSNQLETLQYSMITINQQSQDIQNALSALGPVGQGASTALGALDDAAAGVDKAQNAISAAESALSTYVGGTIADLQDGFQPPSLAFQSQGRIVAIVVILSCIIVLSVFISWLCWREPMGGQNTLLTIAILITVLFFFIFLVLLIGSSVVKSMHSLSKDGCLYAETFVFNTLLDKVADPTQQQWWKRALKFYLRNTDPGSDAPYSAVSEVTGIPLSDILDQLGNPAVGAFLGSINSTVVQIALRTVLKPDTVVALQNVSGVIQPILQSAKNLDGHMSRQNTFPFNYQVKELICCDGAHSAQILFICWTTIGAVGFAFGLLALWRVAKESRSLRYGGLGGVEGDGDTDSLVVGVPEGAIGNVGGGIEKDDKLKMSPEVQVAPLPPTMTSAVV